jgi:hypothetical protein
MRDIMRTASGSRHRKPQEESNDEPLTFNMPNRDLKDLDDAIALFFEMLDDDPGSERLDRFLEEYRNRSEAFQTELRKRMQLALLIWRKAE